MSGSHDAKVGKGERKGSAGTVPEGVRAREGKSRLTTWSKRPTSGTEAEAAAVQAKPSSSSSSSSRSVDSKAPAPSSVLQREEQRSTVPHSKPSENEHPKPSNIVTNFLKEGKDDEDEVQLVDGSLLPPVPVRQQ